MRSFAWSVYWKLCQVCTFGAENVQDTGVDTEGYSDDLPRKAAQLKTHLDAIAQLLYEEERRAWPTMQTSGKRLR